MPQPEYIPEIWSGIDFAKADPSEEMLKRLSENTARFLVNTGLPRLFWTCDFSLLNSPMTTFATSRLIRRKLFTNDYWMFDIPEDLLDLARSSVVFGKRHRLPNLRYDYFCVDIRDNGIFVVSDTCDMARSVNTSIVHFFQCLTVLNEVLVKNEEAPFLRGSAEAGCPAPLRGPFPDEIAFLLENRMKLIDPRAFSQPGFFWPGIIRGIPS